MEVFGPMEFQLKILISHLPGKINYTCNWGRRMDVSSTSNAIKTGDGLQWRIR